MLLMISIKSSGIIFWKITYFNAKLGSSLLYQNGGFTFMMKAQMFSIWACLATKKVLFFSIIF
jgi:hypothetical protein